MTITTHYQEVVNVPVGLVAFSFAHCKNGEPNPCNIRLAKEVTRIARESSDNVVSVCQWEVALALDWTPDTVVKPYPDGSYLDSADVMEKASYVFRKFEVKRVIPIANPFLHLHQCKKLVEEAGFVVPTLAEPIQKIGFDKESDQWWAAW